MSRGRAVFAAIDVGANSAHLLVAAERDGDLEALVDESVLLGLGRLVDETGHVGTEASERLASTIGRYVDTANDLGAQDVVVVATEPLRAAADADTVVESVSDASRAHLHVLRHEEEGILTLLGVTGGRRPVSTLLVADVGGGSTELVLVGPGRAPITTGLRLGSARLSARVAPHDPPTGSEMQALFAAAREAIPAAVASPDEIVAVGGTASNLLKIVPPAAPIEGTLTRAMIDDAVALLVRQPSTVIAGMHGVKPGRAAILPAGAAILAAVLDCHWVDRLTVVEAGIREGLVHVLARAGRAWRDQLGVLAGGWRVD